MTPKQKPVNQNGEVHIKGKKVKINGDVVGRDKITTYQGISGKELEGITEKFLAIKHSIDARPDDEVVNKAELKNVVEQIEQEVKKGDSAKPATIKRWLGFLAGMADDVFDVTVTTLTNPIAGIAKAVKLIAEKAKEEHEQDKNSPHI